MELFQLLGTIAINNSEANDAIKTTQEKASGFGQTLTKGIGTAAKWGTAIVGGATAAATGLVAFATQSASTADNIDKMSQKIGISREAYQELDFICSQSGTSVDSLQAGMKTLTAAMDGVASGTKSNVEQFKRLGVSVMNTDGSFRSQEEVMWETLSALQAMDDQTEKARLATELFGKSGTELMPLLNGATGSIDEMKQQAHDLGLVLSDELIDNGVNLTDSMDQTKRAFAAIGTELAASLMPVVEEASDYIQQSLPEIKALISKIAPIITSALEKVLPLLMNLAETLFPILLSMIEQLIPPLTQVIETVLPIIIKLVSMLLPPLIEIIEAILPIIVTLIEALLPLLEPIISLLEPIIQLSMQLIQPLMQILQMLLPPLIEIIKFLANVLVTYVIPYIEKIAETLSILLAEAIQKAMTIIETLKEVFSTVFEAIRNVVETVVEFVSENIISKFGTVKEKVTEIFTDMKKTVTSIFDGIWDKIKKVINSILGGIESMGNGVIRGVNKIVQAMNNLSFDIPDWVPGLGGKKFGFNLKELAEISIPRLAKGGIVDKPTITEIGEDGTEAVVPLENNTQWMQKLASMGGNDNSMILELLRKIIDLLEGIESDNESLPEVLLDAIANGLRFDVNNREFARLVKESW